MIFNIFKKKTKKEKILSQYKRIKEEAFNISKINRKKSDELEKKAQDLLDKIEKLEQ